MNNVPDGCVMNNVPIENKVELGYKISLKVWGGGVVGPRS